ncbi:hypothetical protein [Liquorilactobacillus oeni]|uniref:hypothetical protein n=1 Tax=Liquorilactobacillus oeni TaxID=303241 RepID=UPI00070F4F71|nr:hypothetical protein [Liquorilactobacillus oeni]
MDDVTFKIQLQGKDYRILSADLSGQRKGDKVSIKIKGEVSKDIIKPCSSFRIGSSKYLFYVVSNVGNGESTLEFNLDDGNN